MPKPKTSLEEYAIALGILVYADLPIEKEDIERITTKVLTIIDDMEENDERLSVELGEWFNTEIEKRGLLEEDPKTEEEKIPQEIEEEEIPEQEIPEQEIPEQEEQKIIPLTDIIPKKIEDIPLTSADVKKFLEGEQDKKYKYRKKGVGRKPKRYKTRVEIFCESLRKGGTKKQFIEDQMIQFGGSEQSAIRLFEVWMNPLRILGFVRESDEGVFSINYERGD